MQEQCVKNENSEKSLSKTTAIEAGRIMSIGGILAFGFLPLDYIRQYLHTTPLDQRKMPATWRLSFSYSVISPMVKTLGASYANSAKAATIRNGVLTQRHTVNDIVTSKKQEEGVHTEETRVNSTTVMQAALVSALIGGVDTTATNWPRLKRAWNFEQARNPAFIMPQAYKALDYYKIFGIGYRICLVKNFLTVGGFFVTPELKQQFEKIMPKPVANFAAVATTAVGIGTLGNLADILYKNQVVRVNPKTYETPSIKQVFRSLFAKEGINFVRRGLLTSVFYSAFAYAFVPEAEKLVEKRVIPKIEAGYDTSVKVVSDAVNKVGFFTSTSQADLPKEEESEVKKTNLISKK